MTHLHEHYSMHDFQHSPSSWRIEIPYSQLAHNGREVNTIDADIVKMLMYAPPYKSFKFKMMTKDGLE